MKPPFLRSISHVTPIAWSGANPGGRIRLPEREQLEEKKMIKLGKKTTATLLIAIFMISVFALAPVIAQDYGDYDLSTTGKGTAEISDDYWHSASHSVKLLLPPIIDGGDMAQVVFDYGMRLDTLDSVSFWGMLENSLGGKPYYSRPRIFLEIDTNGDGKYVDGEDARVEQDMYPVWTALGTWYRDEVDDDGDDNVIPGDGNSHIKIFGDRTGLATDWYVKAMPKRDHAYLGQLKTETYEGETKWGDLTVLRIKVGIGGWTGPYDGTVIAFIDDIKINDVTYDFEPLYWFKASGGGVSYDDTKDSPTTDHFCTLGIIGMSLESSKILGGRVPCKGSGTFIDHELKLKISFNIEEGEIRRTDYLIYFWGTANVHDIAGHKKEYDVPFRLGLVDDGYSYSNRFDVQCYGHYWHAILESGEITVWVWE